MDDSYITAMILIYMGCGFLWMSFGNNDLLEAIGIIGQVHRIWALLLTFLLMYTWIYPKPAIKLYCLIFRFFTGVKEIK